MKKIYLLIAVALLSSATIAGLNNSIQATQTYEMNVAGDEDMDPVVL